jgi:hypothetical protein
VGRGGETMKSRWLDIIIKAKTDAPLKEVRDHYNSNVQLIFNDIEVHKVSIQVDNSKGKEDCRCLMPSSCTAEGHIGVWCNNCKWLGI